mmetsp:Transcript_30683/g.69192  ORF Transcript_30683/g.69192 Transcript_30683/m.69192 type:complete len:404 (-) Transcript_30683:435-1646(-)
MPPSSIPIQAHYLSLSASLASCVYLYSPAFLPHSLSLSLPLSLFLTFFHSSRTPTHTLSNTHIHTHKLPLSHTHAHTPRHTHAHDYTHTRTLTNARAHTRTQAHTLFHWRWHLTARHSHPSLPPFPFSAYDVFHPCQWLNFWGFRGAEVRGRALSAVMQSRGRHGERLWLERLAEQEKSSVFLSYTKHRLAFEHTIEVMPIRDGSSFGGLRAFEVRTLDATSNIQPLTTWAVRGSVGPAYNSGQSETTSPRLTPPPIDPLSAVGGRRSPFRSPLPPRALLGNATPPLPPIGNESLEGKAEQPGQTSPQTTEMNNGRLARGSPVRGSPLRGSPLRGIPTLPTDSSRPARLMGSAARLPAPLEVDEPWRPDILNSNETGELGFRRSKQLTQVRLRRCASAGGQLV